MATSDKKEEGPIIDHGRKKPCNGTHAIMTAIAIAVAAVTSGCKTTPDTHVAHDSTTNIDRTLLQQKMIDAFLAEVTPKEYEAASLHNEERIQTTAIISPEEIIEVQSLLEKVSAKYQQHPVVKIFTQEFESIFSPEKVEMRKSTLQAQGLPEVTTSGLQKFSLTMLSTNLQTTLEHGPDFTAQENSRKEALESMFHYFYVLRKQFMRQAQHTFGKETREIIEEMKRLLRESSSIIHRLEQKGYDPEKEREAFEECAEEIEEIMERSDKYFGKLQFA